MGNFSAELYRTQTDCEIYLTNVERDINYYQPLSAGDNRDYAPLEETDWAA